MPARVTFNGAAIAPLGISSCYSAPISVTALWRRSAVVLLVNTVNSLDKASTNHDITFVIHNRTTPDNEETSRQRCDLDAITR